MTQDRSLILRHKCLLRIYALTRGKIFRNQRAEPLQIELCIGKYGLVTRLVGFRRVQNRFAGRGSIWARRSPIRTSWPSRNAIFRISPSTRTFTVTVL